MSTNILDHQPGFIGPKWNVHERIRFLRDTENVYCRWIADALLKYGRDDAMIDIYLRQVVELRGMIARLGEYQDRQFEETRRWRAAADAAGADLDTFTGPVTP